MDTMVYTALNEAESLMAARMNVKPVHRTKGPKPKRNDIVGEKDETGEWVETYTVARTPDLYTLLRSDITNRTFMVLTDRLVRIAPNMWKFEN